MKASLTQNLVLLSLSALVLVGSGCERRGRAPVKSQTAGSATTLAGTSNPNPAASTTPSTTNPDVSKNPTSANMGCSVALAAGDATAASFKTDVAAMVKFQICMNGVGIVVSYPAKSGDSLDSAIFISETREDETVGLKRIRTKDEAATVPSLRDEFIKLAKLAGSNDNQAQGVLIARLDALKSESKKMADKYAKLDAKTSFTVPAGKASDGITDIPEHQVVLSGILLDLEILQDVADAAEKEVADLRSVSSDGTDLTKSDSQDQQ